MNTRTFLLATTLAAGVAGCTGSTGSAPAPQSPAPADPADEARPAAVPAEAIARPADPAPPTRPDAATVARLEALYQARADSALTGHHPADVHFMAGMIGHHAQALVMSGFAPENGASPTIRTLCARIINAQQDEINLMQRWLRDRGEEVPEIHIEDGHLMIHGPEHAGHMPGMLSAEQLEELRHAKGRDFDRLFLKYMIMHHKGAVTMVLDLFATDGAAQDDFIFKLASDIQADQGSEIERMQLMLDALEGSR